MDKNSNNKIHLRSVIKNRNTWRGQVRRLEILTCSACASSPSSPTDAVGVCEARNGRVTFSGEPVLGAGLASSSRSLCALVPCALLSPEPPRAPPGSLGLSQRGWHRLPGFPVPAAGSVVAHFPLAVLLTSPRATVGNDSLGN